MGHSLACAPSLHDYPFAVNKELRIMTENLRAYGRKSWTQRLKNEMAANWQLYLLILLPVVYLILFHYWPMLGVQIAFKDFKPTKGIWGSPWASSRGETNVLKHFERFLRSPYSLQIIGNTVGISLYSLLAKFPCCAVRSLKRRYRSLPMRRILFLPSSLSASCSRCSPRLRR